MKNSFAAFIVCIGLVAITPLISRGETKSGPVALKEFNSSSAAPVAVTLGTNVKVTCKFRISDFFGAKAINSGAEIENTSQTPMYYAFNVAFFDADHNLIGCASQMGFSQPLKPGDKTQLGSCIILVPEDQMKKVASYEVTWYESEKKTDI